MIIDFNPLFSKKSWKSLSSKAVSRKFVIFWNSTFIQWCHILCSKQSQVINNFLPFFWWNVNFFYFFFFSFSIGLRIEVILSAILFPIKSAVASAVFWTTLFEVAFVGSIPVFFAVNFDGNVKLLKSLLFFHQVL